MCMASCGFQGGGRGRQPQGSWAAQIMTLQQHHQEGTKSLCQAATLEEGWLLSVVGDVEDWMSVMQKTGIDDVKDLVHVSLAHAQVWEFLS